MNKLASKKILAFLLLLNIAIIGACFFTFSIISETNSKTSATASEIEFYQEKEETVSSLDNLLREVSEQSDKLTSFFVGSDGIVSFIEEVEGLATESGLDFNLSSVEISPANNDLVENLSMNIDARGSWEEINYFLSALEYLPFSINVNNLVLSEIQQALRTEVSSEEGDIVVIQGGVWRAVLDIEVLKFK